MIKFKQSRDIKEYRPLIDSLIEDFDYVFLHTILQWCKLATDDSEGDNQHWEVYLVEQTINNETSVIGICGLYTLYPHDTKELWLGWFGLVPELRNKNIGKDVMTFLYDEAKKVGCTEILSYVDKEGKPLSFYKREGFDVIGTVKDFLKTRKGVEKDEFENEDDIVIKKKI